jgi:hypothetical protein
MLRTHLPGINHDISVPGRQDANGHNVVQPVVVRVAGFKLFSEMDSAVGLFGAFGLYEYVGPVRRPEVVPRVWMERDLIIVRVRPAPVGSKVYNGAFRMN